MTDRIDGFTLVRSVAAIAIAALTPIGSAAIAGELQLPKQAIEKITGTSADGQARRASERLNLLTARVGGESGLSPVTVNRQQAKEQLGLIKHAYAEEWSALRKRFADGSQQQKAWDQLKPDLDARFSQAEVELKNGALNSKTLSAPNLEATEFAKPNFVSEQKAFQSPSIDLGSLPSYLVSRSSSASSNKPFSKTDSGLLRSAPNVPTDASVCNYTAADLGTDSTPQAEASLTPEIRALAETLEFSPVAIYRYVTNEIRFEPYYGSLKGAQGVLTSRAGNATDQASLLIALLRASNFPARYVKGVVSFDNDARLKNWVGAKSFVAVANVLAQGRIPVSLSGNTVQFTHVWVEACVPYGNYRGLGSDQQGYRWMPLDSSFKLAEYQPGVNAAAAFDFTGYMSQRRNETPAEWYEKTVLGIARTLPPYYANSSISDVAYAGRLLPVRVDVLPASLPFTVAGFTNWDTGLTAEVAKLPEKHRYKLAIDVRSSSNAALVNAVTLTLPESVLSRTTLSFKGATASDQTALNNWRNDGNPDSSSPCTVNVVPSIKVDETEKTTTTGTSVGLCTVSNKLTMTLTLSDINSPTVNSVTLNTIAAANYHALNVYAYHASDALIAARTAKLLNSVKLTPSPNSNPEEVEGEFLHIAGLKYMRYISDSAKRVAGLDGGSGESGLHLGITATKTKVQYLFDLPFAVNRSGLYIDFPGAQSRNVDLSTGKLVWKTFKVSGYGSSYFESYIWQEIANMDAVSTVRGIQFAAERGISVLTINSANWTTESAKLTSNSNTALNYTSTDVASIKANYVDNGYTLTIPRSLVQYDTWKGALFVAEKNLVDSPTNPSASAAYVINKYSGGYTTGSPIGQWYDSILGTGYTIESGLPTAFLTGDDVVTSLAGANGYSLYNIWAGDPVNMVTGNMYHNETDLTLKGRGNFPIVFSRAYNSRNPLNGPLGYGWSHSFNHYLKFYGIEGGVVKLSWIDGSGGERFFWRAGTSVPNGSTFSNPPGVTSSLMRKSDGTYSITEKNGLTYTFASNAGTTTGQTAKLLSIADANGNTLSMGYTSTKLSTITDGLGRVLTFTYDTSNRIYRITDWSGRTWEYGYNTSGDLTSYKNPRAFAGLQPAATYSYYGAADGEKLNHAMKRFASPNGGGMTFEYYANGRVSRHCNDVAECQTFTYNDFRRESVSVNERGFSKRYFFDSSGNPTKIVDENGNYQTYAYDAAKPMLRTKERDALGLETQYAYDPSGNISVITRPSGATVELSYYYLNKPRKVKDERGNYKLYKLDTKGNLLEVLSLKSGVGAAIDPTTYTPVQADLIDWVIFTYDSYGNIASSKHVRDFSTKVGPVQTFNYNDTLNGVLGLNAVRITRQGDRDGNGSLDSQEFVDIKHDNLGRITNGVNDSWEPVSFQYNELDLVTSATDIPVLKRDYAFDANGNRIAEIATTKAISKNGPAVITIHDQLAWGYDIAGRMVTSIDAAGYATRKEYDGAGNVRKVTNPDGYTIAFDYDPTGKVVRAFDQQDHFVSRRLDAAGRTREETDPNGNTTKYEYYGATQDGRLKRKIDALGRITEYSYDLSGNVTSVKDPKGNLSYTSYDELNRVVRVVEPAYSDVSFGSIRPVTTYRYSTLGKVVEIKAGRTDSTGTSESTDVLLTQATYQFDDFGRKLKETDALAKSTIFSDYDTFGNLGKVTDAKGQITQFTWKYGHRLDTQTDHLGRVTSYTYNTLGQVINVAGPAVTYTYTYDTAHRLASVLDSRGSKSLTYAYSPGGLLRSMTDNSGKQTNYIYDASGRLTEIWAPGGEQITLAYDAGGRLLEKWLPNGISARYQWNTDNTLKQLVNRRSSSAIISQHDYTYDELGNRLTSNEVFDGVPRNQKYVYDALSRLSEVRTNDASNTLIESNSYDVFGNRVLQNAAGVTRAFVHDAAQQLLEVHQGTVSGALLAGAVYDVNGSMTKLCEGAGVTRTGTDCSGSVITGLQYDVLNKLTQVNKTGLPTEQYIYDHSGNRISKATGGVMSQYLYSGDGIYAEYGSNWNIPDGVYTSGGIDTPFLRSTGNVGGTRFYHQDGLGSAIGASDEGGNLTGLVKYDAWGGVSSTTGTISQFGYTGREPTSNSLIYYRARYYSPSLGRFTQRDPAGFIDGVSRYAYVKNNPTNSVDPTGLAATSAILTQYAQISYTGAGQSDMFSSDTGFWQQLGAQLPGIPDPVVDAFSGFGDGVSTILSFGFYNTADARSDWDIGSVNTTSTSYNVGTYGGYAWGVGTLWAAGLNGGTNSVFWSGYSQGARGIAEGMGTTLELTPIGRALDVVHNTLGINLPNFVWRAASATFAANADGVATAVVLSENPLSIWATVERAILSARGIPIVYP
ncbi:type IV secretion protein Rhs [Permianibacter sp. IMCC34836]|uniref:RHS repeat-associated core domain-containing protein n=1 Tax=Permianibacter fluminis TaxID=2738515 RepID=UPI00155462EE|nr:RHS repeat-associated core domain-containing protein [Permianibacter fluminis]NQD36438.1 type IV secretion protein Rhs [Permianibacter fluminis]